MDIKIISTIINNIKYLDVYVNEEGCSVDISGKEEKLQQAEVAAFLTRGSTPQNEDDGVDWQNFITGNKSFGELDNDIKENLEKINMDADPIELFVDYDVINNKLKTVIKEVTSNV
jgi:hypothetical protein